MAKYEKEYQARLNIIQMYIKYQEDYKYSEGDTGYGAV